MSRTGCDPIGIGVPDLAAAKRYYDELMPVLGLRPSLEATPGGGFSFGPNGARRTRLLFYQASEKDTACDGGGLQHLAFRVASRGIVREAHAWALARSAEILHAPRDFPEYGQHYATYWLDPHGFVLEVVSHSAEDS